MIINSQYPNKSLYLLGGNVLAILKDNLQNRLSLDDLHDKYELTYGLISFPYFIYTLDWLYIISAIDLDHNGGVGYVD
ncbi:ABC-three component system middle component 6 [Lelliottia amnigena]|uniref:ABC-three component system middle component 6 n=1 Tax=Lelliottia amnigena TaxID=61646 RepID=UPI0029539AE1|nr:ABC-three component system middle component 6 [Lelliottia amnigena]